MFPESSTWQADIVRVTADGSADPGRASRGPGTAGRSWRRTAGWRSPGRRRHADAGLDNQLAFLDAALDYVARNTPARHRDRLPRGRRHDLAQHRRARGRRAAQRRAGPRMTTTVTAAGAGRRRTRVDELLGRPVSMRAMALLRILVAPIVLLHLRPLLEDAWHGDIYRDHFHEPYASWYPELPRDALHRPAVDGGARRGGDDRRVPGPRGDDHRLGDRHVRPVPVDDELPQQPGLPRARARRPRRHAVRPGAVARRLARPPARRPAAPDDVAGLAAVAAALRGGHGLRRVGPQQAARPRLVQRRR